MDFYTYSKKLILLELYIINRWANTPCTISKKLGVSERTVLRMIDHLKKQGKEIKYWLSSTDKCNF